MKIAYMMPTPSQARQDETNSINQIVLRLEQALPQHGWALTEDKSEADIIVANAGQTDGQTPCDVAICHGLYPTAHYAKPDWHWAANAHVIKNLISARYTTAPTQWVADILRRDMHLSPHVIPFAIDWDEWQTDTPKRNIVLWNKTRQDSVCDPTPMLELAKRARAAGLPLEFVTTFGESEHVTTIGRQPYPAMKEYIQSAAIYLGVTKETFGIGTLEAMAAGAVVLGYDWGGTGDIIQHDDTGYLVKPGDIDGLFEGLKYCLTHRERLSAAAREQASTYRWSMTAYEFAKVFDMAAASKEEPVKVSVIIPVHNYATYVYDAIQSAIHQTTNFEYEIIVVDDCSTDDSAEIARRVLDDVPVKGIVLQTTQNSGPAEARNLGITYAHGDYILCLDADDMLGSEHMLQTFADALDADRRLGIVYSRIKLIDEQNTIRAQVNGWPDGYDFEAQLRGKNQVPTCCMFRAEAWRKAGGFRTAQIPAEDADLWTRIALIGYHAKQVTDEPWFVYRVHSDSLSRTYKTPDWWTVHQYAIKDKPFAAPGNPPKRSWPVRNYDTPDVSIIIPVGPGHEHYLADALDSVRAQTYWNWDCHVVFDFDYVIPPDQLNGHPWAKFYWSTGQGAGAARNLGAKQARGKFLVFLDADDMLHPEFIEKTLKVFRYTGRYIYTDWTSLNKDGVKEHHKTPTYEQSAVFRQTSIHAVTALIPRRDFIEVGGFDETMEAWEDVDLYMKLAANGYCGHRLPEPLFTYRYATGSLREHGETIKPSLKAVLHDRYGEYMEGKPVGCGCGGAKRIQIESQALEGDMVRVQYTGEAVPVASHQVRGGATRQRYGDRRKGDIFFIYRADLEHNPDKFIEVTEYDVAAD